MSVVTTAPAAMVAPHIFSCFHLHLILSAQNAWPGAVSESYPINFRFIPGRGLAMKVRFKNLDQCEYVDDVITRIFDQV